MNIPSVCSIGTTDPWNAAGLGLDIRALAECGVRPLSVVAGVSAQDAKGLHALLPIDPRMIDAQFDALHDAPIVAYRIGALLDAASVEVVVERITRRPAPVVWDPVIGASGGGEFMSETTLRVMRELLLPLSWIVTPNLREAERLLEQSVGDADAMGVAARRLVQCGARSALITGGHLTGDPIDVFFDGTLLEGFSAERIPGDVRGTGCLVAAALAAALARDASLLEAVHSARSFVRKKISDAQIIGEMSVAY
ncbi:MAG TPA: bifunctional hydroxymethylpyrimidine kinase/phosphomethylpyrimidine kinase [Candidatus Baltobacteraceae bacterium]|jgi:hydroxymethylpyrimidine kinase/phosphomethylpyrimidine kinase|nr:bifunctional hydroxymethylpyrimidine kinase/phosphomethylpyrimidine kinase [Candidatus Baltobacteraceae bacterium]